MINIREIIIPTLTSILGFFAKELYTKIFKKEEYPVLNITYNCEWKSQSGVFPRQYTYGGKIVIENASNFHSQNVELIFKTERIKDIFDDKVLIKSSDKILKNCIFPNQKWELTIKSIIKYHNQDYNDCPPQQQLFPNYLKKVVFQVKYENNKGTKYKKTFSKDIDI